MFKFKDGLRSKQAAIAAGSSISTRMLGEYDALFYKGLRLEALRRFPGSFSLSNFYTEAEFDDRVWKDKMRSGTYFGAFEDKRLVGIANWELDEGGNSARIRGVYSAAAGAGRAIMRRCEDTAMEKGLHLLRLTVTSQSERAIEMYKKCGFSAVDTYEFRNIATGMSTNKIDMIKCLGID